MTTLNDEASRVALQAGATACTDVTGFGLLGHALSMVRKTSVGFVLDHSILPVLDRVKDMIERGMVPEGAYNNLRFLEGKVDFSSEIGEEERLLMADPQTSGGLLFGVDRKRGYLIGHSNGGRMAYRMACQPADIIAGLASLAGMPFLDPSRCGPAEPVNILHIHGTADTTDPYGGGALTSPTFPANMPPSPGAEKAVQLWAGYNGATDPVTDPAPSLDLTTDVAGLDTVIARYTTCPPGGAVELWTINDGGHSPSPSAEFSPRVIGWLLAHPKP